MDAAAGSPPLAKAAMDRASRARPSSRPSAEKSTAVGVDRTCMRSAVSSRRLVRVDEFHRYAEPCRGGLGSGTSGTGIAHEQEDAAGPVGAAGGTADGEMGRIPE